jgi:hypothetical protein
MEIGTMSTSVMSPWIVGPDGSKAINPCQFLIRDGLVFFEKFDEKSSSFLLPKQKVVPK